MELKLPQEESIAPRHLHLKNAFVAKHYNAMFTASEEVKLSGKVNGRHPWPDIAIAINKNHDNRRAVYDREMLRYLEEHNWNLEYYCDPNYYAISAKVEDMKDENGRQRLIRVPFNYFAAPVKVGGSSLVRDSKPVYHNHTNIPFCEPDDYSFANRKYTQMAAPLPEVKVTPVSWYYDGRRSPLVPLLLTIPLVIFVWNMRYGSVDGVAIQQSLQAAMQQSALMKALCFIPEWIMGVLNAFIEFVGSDGSVDSEILGGIIIYAVLGFIACAGIFLALAFGIGRSKNPIRNRKQWRALKKQAKAEKAENREIRAKNAQRLKDAEAYRKSPEYQSALQSLARAKAETEHRRELAEQWHRAWYKAACANWDNQKDSLQPHLTYEITEEEFRQEFEDFLASRF